MKSYLLAVALLSITAPLYTQDITYRGGDGNGGANALYSGAVTLPLDIVSFSAILTGSVVHLHWTTQNEVATESFTVERSADGRLFSAIFRQPAAGDAGDRQLDYTATDPTPLPAGAYYRLRVTDFDATVTHSAVVYVAGRSPEALFSLYPNPAAGAAVQLVLTDAILGTGEVTVRVYHTDGREVFITQKATTRGPAPFIDLPAGSYLVQLVSADGREQHELLTILR